MFTRLIQGWIVRLSAIRHSFFVSANPRVEVETQNPHVAPPLHPSVLCETESVRTHFPFSCQLSRWRWKLKLRRNHRWKIKSCGLNVHCGVAVKIGQLHPPLSSITNSPLVSDHRHVQTVTHGGSAMPYQWVTTGQPPTRWAYQRSMPS